MSDRQLPVELRERLAAALNAGARLRAPLPSQARYAREGVQMGAAPTVRARVLTLAVVAALVLGLLAVAGPQQPRVWIEQKVSKAIQDVGIPLQPSGSAHKSAVATPPTRPSGEDPTAGAPGNSGPGESPEPAESADGAQPSQGGAPSSEAEPSPSPDPSGGDRGGGDSSPQASPSPDNG